MNTDQFYEKRLNDRIRELMAKGEKYYPFDHDNFYEFLMNITDEQSNSLADWLLMSSVTSAGLQLYGNATDFWYKLAKTQAEAELEDEYNSCDNCHGIGCRQCNEDERTENRE